MRAANQPPSSTAVVSNQVHFSVYRILVARLSTVALLLVWHPAVVHGQEAGGRIVSVFDTTVDQLQDAATTTHVVRAGETLWGIAARYFGDGHQWPTLARRNRLAIKGPAPLQVGTKLTVPVSPVIRQAKAAVVAAAPADSTVPSVALATAGEDTLPSPAPAVASARQGTRIGLVDLEAQEASRKSTEVETVFHRDLPDAAEAERRTRAVLRPNAPAPRQAEFDAAPFVVSPSDLVKAGSIIRRIGSAETTESGYPQRAIVTDQIEVRPPAGVTYSVGQRLVAVTTPAAVDKQTLIAIPAGIVEIVRVEAGKPAVAVLMRQSGRVEQGQRLLPATGASAPWLTAQKIEAPDVRTSVRWIDPHELQPTLQSFLMLAAGSTQGVKAGDEFGLYRRGTTEQPAQESLVATVRVVRSEVAWSSAVITRQYQSDIAVGLSARRVAKAP